MEGNWALGLNSFSCISFVFLCVDVFWQPMGFTKLWTLHGRDCPLEEGYFSYMCAYNRPRPPSISQASKFWVCWVPYGWKAIGLLAWVRVREFFFVPLRGGLLTPNGMYTFIGTDGGDGMHFAGSACFCGFSCRSVSNASWIPLEKHPRCKWSDYNCLTFGIKQTDEINRQWIRLVLFTTTCSTNFASFVCPDPGDRGVPM